MAKLKDYTGQKFGRLECVSFAARVKGTTIWTCKCDCGALVDVRIQSLLYGSTKSCGCLQRELLSIARKSKFKDYTGQKFGRLECLSLSEPAQVNGRTFWKCKCDCGKIVDVSISHVVNGDTKSCGCLKSFNDYTGQKFGHLECISLSEPAQVNGKTFWRCKCDCGQIVDVNIGSVIDGSTRSCGCLRKTLKDYTGQKFGRLECISPSEPARVNGATFWKCRCDCGKIIDINIAHVVLRGKRSCGCLKRSCNLKSSQTARV